MSRPLEERLAVLEEAISLIANGLNDDALDLLRGLREDPPVNCDREVGA